MFSAKADYRDYHHKVTTYVGRNRPVRPPRNSIQPRPLEPFPLSARGTVTACSNISTQQLVAQVLARSARSFRVKKSGSLKSAALAPTSWTLSRRPRSRRYTSLTQMSFLSITPSALRERQEALRSCRRSPPGGVLQRTLFADAPRRHSTRQLQIEERGGPRSNSISCSCASMLARRSARLSTALMPTGNRISKLEWASSSLTTISWRESCASLRARPNSIKSRAAYLVRRWRQRGE